MKAATHARYAFVLASVAAIALTGCSGQKKSDEVKVVSESVQRLQDGVVEFATSQQHWPSKMSDLKVDGDAMPGVSYTLGEGGVVAVYFAEGSALAGANLVYQPTQDKDGNVTWSCKSQGMEAGLKPAGCI